MRHDGQAVFAFRTRKARGVGGGLCIFGARATGHGRVHWSAATTPEGSDGDQSWQNWFQAAGALDTRAGGWRLTPPNGNTMTGGAVTEELIAYQLQGAGWVMLIDTRNGEPRIFEDIVGNPQNMNAVGDHAIWEEWASDKIRLAHASLTDDNALYYELDGPADIRAFDTDGVNMVWMQGYGRECVYGCPDEYDRVEIWTAPYARHPDDMRPRLVTTHHSRMGWNFTKAGRVAFLGPPPGHSAGELGPRNLYVVDLDDGRKRVLHENSGEAFGAILYLADDHVLLGVANEEDHSQQWLLRVEVDSIPYE